MCKFPGERIGWRSDRNPGARLAATSLSWASVQPLIGDFARVVSYDRAGLGWSDNTIAPATARNAADDLHLLLDGAELSAPYILVGHSLGGLIVGIVFQQVAALNWLPTGAGRSRGTGAVAHAER